MSEQKPEPLYKLSALVNTVDEWAKRHRINRQAADEVGIALERMCDFYEQERQRLYAELALRSEWQPSTMFIYEYPDGKRGLVYVPSDAQGQAQLRYVVDLQHGDYVHETIIVLPDHLRLWELSSKQNTIE